MMRLWCRIESRGVITVSRSPLKVNTCMSHFLSNEAKISFSEAPAFFISR